MKSSWYEHYKLAREYSDSQGTAAPVIGKVKSWQIWHFGFLPSSINTTKIKASASTAVQSVTDLGEIEFFSCIYFVNVLPHETVNNCVLS